jgi:hypothetical protein
VASSTKSTGALATDTATVSLDMFHDAKIFESAHCKGPATMVFTMKQHCRVADRKEIYSVSFP